MEARAASMRPRLIASENEWAHDLKLPPYRRFNEAEADRLGKPLREVRDELAAMLQ